MEITVWAKEHNSPCHPQMQVKALSCKEEAICEHDLKTSLSSLGQSSLKWTEIKWKTAGCPSQYLCINCKKLICGNLTQYVNCRAINRNSVLLFEKVAMDISLVHELNKVLKEAKTLENQLKQKKESLRKCMKIFIVELPY
uniref:Uncharacterized protein n=1 Tax=Erpetoichthys calabaricus TaxID=27687 RepID=A0A8C4T9N4_ERPCA